MLSICNTQALAAEFKSDFTIFLLFKKKIIGADSADWRDVLSKLGYIEQVMYDAFLSEGQKFRLH